MSLDKQEYGGVWIVAEQSRGVIEPVSFELLTRGTALAVKRGTRLSAMVFGGKPDNDELQKLISRGADMVVAVEDERLEYFTPPPYSQAMIDIIETYKPEIILAAATSTGRTLMPYVAIKVNTGLTADCTILDIEDGTGNLLQTRPAIGGNILATIKTPDHRPQMATIRPHSTPQAPIQAGRTGQVVRHKLSRPLNENAITRTGFTPNAESISIADAGKVVVVGRGIKKGENIPLIYELADALGAAVGATRDVVDRGWLSYPHQVGLSGQTINPRLYVGVGVSGAIQHLAGMQTAGRIIAINSDPGAEIFKIADMGIVGNLFDVVPAIIKQLKNGGSLL